MRHPIPRFVRWTVVFAVLAAVAVSVFQHWDARQVRKVASGAAREGWTQTAWGPLGPTDRIMLEKVRQAGLWEMTMGQLAEQQASDRQVREIGGLLSAERGELDTQVSETAEQLGVSLPSQPNQQQQGWITEISSKSGPDLDRVFVQRVSAAHDQVFPLLAQVRSGTRNELIRSLAATATELVIRHQRYLATTRLVDVTALPEPRIPGSSTPLAAGVTTTAGVPTAAAAAVYTVAVVYLVVPLAVGALLWLLVTAGRRARSTPHQPLPTPRSHSWSSPQPPVRQTVRSPSDVPARPRHAAQR